MASKSFTVLVADRHSGARSGVRAVLAGEHCKVIEAGTGLEAIALANKHQPQLAVLDIPMPDINGLLAAHAILTSPVGTRVLMLTDYTRDCDIERAMLIRVHGFMCKSSPIEKLRDAVKAIRGGQTWFDDKVEAVCRRYSTMPGFAQRERPHFTPRELEVMCLIGNEREMKEVAQELKISVKTACRHRDAMMRKSDTHNTAGIIRYGKNIGYILE